MTKFAIFLNELMPGLRQRLPPTDSRLRPDQYALEQGIFDQVTPFMKFICTVMYLQVTIGSLHLRCWQRAVDAKSFQCALVYQACQHSFQLHKVQRKLAVC